MKYILKCIINLENGDDEVDGAATTNASNMSSTSRKRKRPNNATMFAEVLRETIGSLDQMIVTAIESLGDKISNHARQARLDAKNITNLLMIVVLLVLGKDFKWVSLCQYLFLKTFGFVFIVSC